jgi:hypothetical protein
MISARGLLGRARDVTCLAATTCSTAWSWPIRACSSTTRRWQPCAALQLLRACACACAGLSHAASQVRKHKATSDNTSGLYVFVSSLPPRRLIVAAKRFVRRCARGHRALRYEKMLERARRAKITAVEGSRPGLLRSAPLFSSLLFSSLLFSSLLFSSLLFSSLLFLFVLFLIAEACGPLFFLCVDPSARSYSYSEPWTESAKVTCPVHRVLTHACRFTPQQRRPSRLLLAPAAASHSACSGGVPRFPGQWAVMGLRQHGAQVALPQPVPCYLLAFGE